MSDRWAFITAGKWQRRAPDGILLERSDDGLWRATFTDGKPVLTAAGEPAEATHVETLMGACDRGELRGVLQLVED